MNQNQSPLHNPTQQYKIAPQQINIIHHPPPPPSVTHVQHDPTATSHVVGHIDDVLQTRGTGQHPPLPTGQQQQQQQQNNIQRFSNMPGGGFTAFPQQQPQPSSQRQEKKSSGATTSSSTTGNFANASTGTPNHSFKNLFAKYLKKRSRSGQYSDGLATNLLASGEDVVDEKLEFMAQIISIQSAKIKRLEDRLRHLEMLLPDYGPFDPQHSSNPEEEHDHDEKEKRPQTAYQTFMQTEIPKIKAKNPDIAQKDAFKIAANNWTNLKNDTNAQMLLEQQQPETTSPPHKKLRNE
jgi:hypothetical protein